MKQTQTSSQSSSKDCYHFAALAWALNCLCALYSKTAGIFKCKQQEEMQFEKTIGKWNVMVRCSEVCDQTSRDYVDMLKKKKTLNQ